MEIKQVIVVRTDLKMGKGKIAAQAGHAAVLGAEQALKSNPEWYRQWKDAGQQKVVLKVGSLKQLKEVMSGAMDLAIPYSVIVDAGHTQIEPGTTTCVSLGPASEELIDKVTGDLKLL